MKKSPDEIAYDRLVKIADRSGFEVWSPNGHLNNDLSVMAGDILIDDNPAWDRGTRDSLPLTLKRAWVSEEDTVERLQRLKHSLAKRGFRLAEELPRLSDGFSKLAEGVVAKKTTDVHRRNILEITITGLPQTEPEEPTPS